MRARFGGFGRVGGITQMPRPARLLSPAAALLVLPLVLVSAPGILTAQSTGGSAGGPGSGPGASAQMPGTRPVGTMSELMVDVLYPYSDAVFYITSRTPTSEEEWLELQGKTLVLAESANLLMMPGRGWGGEERREQWMEDALLLLEAGEAAYEAAKARDVDALADLNGQLYESCVQCHTHFRPDYGRR